jgi:hypothetical protein
MPNPNTNPDFSPGMGKKVCFEAEKGRFLRHNWAGGPAFGIVWNRLCCKL